MPDALDHEGPYKFYVPSGAHSPAHVHVQRDKNAAIFELAPVCLRDDDNYGFPQHELTRIRDIIKEHRTEILKTYLRNCD
jgi:hypothetical protein